MTKEEAIKGLKEFRRAFSGYKPNEEMLDMAIKSLEQEPRWTPCSEKLPDKSGRYLTFIVNQYDDRFQYVMTCEYSDVLMSKDWFPDDECASDNVIAWMPLPKPYEAESEGNNGD